MEKELYYILVHRTLFSKPKIASEILTSMPDPKMFLNLTKDYLCETFNLAPIQANNLLNLKNIEFANKELKRLKELDIKIIPIFSENYPYLLKNIHDPPPVIFVWGSTDFGDLSASIVGSRKCTYYGRECAFKFASELSGTGISIVSGLAEGIDSSAHKGSLSCGGKTLGILGCGLNVIYPKSNKHLFNEIKEKGTLVSEYFLDEEPKKENFPRRNRIIAGISKVTLVIEANIKSGSLITAKFALNEGREVYALPGNITSEKSCGTNLLIRSGAKPILDTKEIIRDIFPDVKPLKRKKTRIDLSNDEEKIYSFIGFDPIYIDEILKKCEMSSSKVASTLLEMELKGVVKQVEGKKFVRIF